MIDNVASLARTIERRGLRVRWRSDPPWLFTGHSNGDVFVGETVQLSFEDGGWTINETGPGQWIEETRYEAFDDAAASVLRFVSEKLS